MDEHKGGKERRKWKQLKIKPKSGQSTHHHEDYFLVRSVQMDVLIKKWHVTQQKTTQSAYNKNAEN